MNPGLITSLLESLIRILPKDIVKKGIDNLLDVIEDAVAKSSNKWDDSIVLPLLSELRKQIGVTEEAGSPYADAKPDVQVNVSVAKDGTASAEVKQ